MATAADDIVAHKQNIGSSAAARLIDHLFEYSSNAVALTAIVTIALGAAVWLGPDQIASVSRSTVLAWWLATSLVLGYRLLVSHRYKLDAVGSNDPALWTQRYGIGAALSGVCWGLGSAFLLAQSESVADAMILMVIAAMVVSAIPYLAMIRWIYRSYLLGCTVPVFLSLSTNDDLAMRTMSMFVLIFAAGIWMAGDRFGALIQRSLVLQYESDNLSRRLQSSNTELERVNDQLALDIDSRIRAETDLIEARRAAESASRAKSTFLSNMSHELRTPLNAILGFAELLSVLPAAEIKRHRDGHLKQIQLSGRHLLSLIENVLDVARMEDTEIELNTEDVLVADVIRECAAILEPDIRELEAEFHFNPESLDDLCIETDRLRLRQVLLNLLSNAIKYNNVGGIVAVELSQSDQQSVRISVSDSGSGIAKEDVARIFDPFVRVGEDKQRVQGTGIGLTITRQLIVAMGGQINVSSVVGDGTRFDVDLPIHSIL